MSIWLSLSLSQCHKLFVCLSICKFLCVLPLCLSVCLSVSLSLFRRSLTCWAQAHCWRPVLTSYLRMYWVKFCPRLNYFSMYVYMCVSLEPIVMSAWRNLSLSVYFSPISLFKLHLTVSLSVCVSIRCCSCILLTVSLCLHLHTSAYISLIYLPFIVHRKYFSIIFDV